MKTRLTKNGFTLIELMVVISIIGLMSSIVLAALNTARAKARDTQKIQALEEIKKALTLYYDAHGYYPLAPSILWLRSYSQSSSYANTWSSTLGPLLAPAYIPNLPQDTSSATHTAVNPTTIWGTDAGYAYSTDVNADGITASAYQLFTRFETSNPLQCSTKNYTAKFQYGSGFFTTFVQGASFCSGGNAASNANLYVVSSD